MSSSKIISLSGWDISQINNDMNMNNIMHRLRTPGEEIAFTEGPKIHF